MTIVIVFLTNLIFACVNEDVEYLLIEKLENQQDCWNVGDFDCFMADYWHNDSLVYIGKETLTYGWSNTLARYKTTYPTLDEMGKLELTSLSVEPLSIQYYFMIGHWKLKRNSGDVEGHFSLIWKKIDGEWIIIADHSS